MKHSAKRSAALFIAVVMALSLVNVSALAARREDDAVQLTAPDAPERDASTPYAEEPAAALAAEPVDLVTSSCGVQASSGQSTAANAINGNLGNQWASDNMKTGGADAKPNAEQTHQWLVIDLGTSHTYPVAIDSIKIFYGAKIWPMVYRVETSATGTDGSWTTLVSVSRGPSANGVKNGTGQTIAGDPTGTDMNKISTDGSNSDTITKTSVPALAQDAAVQRYVRYYVEKVNTMAGGDNTAVRDFQIFAAATEPVVDVNAVLALATTSSVTATGDAVSFPEVPEGATLAVVGSEFENVIANDGSVGGKNIGSRDVRVIVRAAKAADPTQYAEKNLTLTVPDHKSGYDGAWFPTVTAPNPKPEVIPAIQEWYGYTGDFVLKETSRIVVNDRANVGLQKAAANMKADLKEITGLDLPTVRGTSGRADDIYIESLPSDSYDVGDEGYLMRVSDDGVKIYAPSYTGCLFGTITVEQILWQAADHLSVPKGIMRDYPAYAVRGIKLDVARTPYRYQQLKDYAKIMLWYKMSEYDLHINDNDNANINGATFETHSGFHRLESETFPSLAARSGTKHAGIPAALVNEDYYNNNEDYQGNPVYTKEQWRALQQLAQDNGMYLLTEIDLPGHSLLYNKYAQDNPDNVSWLTGGTMPASSFTDNAGYLELLDLTGTNKDRALQFAKELWGEYTGGSEPAIYGDIVHIGADEYWVHNDQTNPAFASFANEMRKIIQGNLSDHTKIRMWGASSTSFSTATTTLNMTHAQLAEHFQLDVWAPNYDDAALRCSQGYQVVNCRDAFLYGNPGRSKRDVVNAEYLFNNWDPTMFGGGNPRIGEANLIGAKAVVWGDQSQEGMTERDVHQRVLRAIAILSEKTWRGGTHSEGEFSDYELRFNRLAEGPGTQIAMDVPSKTSLVLDYDFRNTVGGTVYDASGNGYDAALTGGAVDDEGWLTFDGDTLLTTGLKTLPYPYTVTFDLKAAGTGNDEESSLFSGYDGRIQVAGHNGNMSADVNYFTRDFGYAALTDGTAVNVTIVGTHQATRLYVDGRLVTFLSQKQDQDGVAAGNVQTLYSSVLLPLEKIGQDFHGQLANIKVYNKALSADEVEAAYTGVDDGLVNVAQNAVAGGSSPSGPSDDAVQRVCYAAKAIDGEEEELWSYWKADSGSNALTIDLGQTRAISRIEPKWRDAAPSYTLQVSVDGKTWRDRSNTATAVANARFVRVNVTGEGKLTELLVYEKVDKAALAAKVAEAEEMVAAKGLDFETTGEDGAFFDAVVLARAVNASPLSTVADVTQTLADLTEALDGQTLPEIPDDTVDKRGLQGTYNTMDRVQNSGFTAESWNAFQDAKTAAETVLGDPDATQSQVNAAENALNAAFAALKKPSPTGGGSTGSSGTGNAPAPSVPTTPATPSTNVTTRADGAQVTTVTLPSGEVTSQTVKLPDGTTAKTVKGKDAGVVVTVTDPQGGTLAQVALPAEDPALGLTFLDVPRTHWGQAAIGRMAALGLVNGVGERRYEPGTPMTRGALATVLFRLSNGESAAPAGGFADVSDGAWYADGVNWAARTGVVQGVNSGGVKLFWPGDTVTREQFAVMLARYAKLLGMDATADLSALTPFTDRGNVGEWSRSGVAWCVDKGVLQGRGGSDLDPTAPVTRAEAAVMLDRFLGLIGK